MCCLFYLWEAVGDCTEHWIAWELKLCVILRYFHLYDNTDSGVFSWGFPQSILLCFMCMISSSLLYVFWLILLKLIKLPQSLIVEVDQVFCFSYIALSGDLQWEFLQKICFSPTTKGSGLPLAKYCETMPPSKVDIPLLPYVLPRWHIPHSN